MRHNIIWHRQLVGFLGHFESYIYIWITRVFIDCLHFILYRGSSRYFTANWSTNGNTIQFDCGGRRSITPHICVQVWKWWCKSSDNLFITIANFPFVFSDGKNKFEAYREFTQANGRPFIRAIIKCRIEYLGEIIFDLNESYAYGDPRKFMA